PSVRRMSSPAYFTPMPWWGSGGRKPRILAATSPTRCLSAPVTTTSVWVGVLMVMPSGTLNSTGCEKPSDRFRSLPCIAARYPTPTSSSLRSKPSDTPCTMFATIARRVPVMAMRSGSLVDSCAWPFSTLISTSAGLAIDSVPFGPLTLTVSAWTFSSTPFGRAIGFLATRDMFATPLGHEAQDFTADALLARLRVGHDAFRGGDDGDAQPIED